MATEQITAPEVSLPSTLPAQLPPPLFQLDQILKFGKVPTGDFGRVVGYVFAAAASVQAKGFHYLLVLDPESPSRKELGILSDWIFEGDAELMMMQQRSTQPIGHSSQQGHSLQQGQE